MLNQLLLSLGLDDDETKTYSLLLETGPISAGNLAKQLGAPRSSLYGFLARLKYRGLVTESSKRSIKLFTAVGPEKINLLFEQKIEQLQNQQALYKKLLPDLLKARARKYVAPKLQIFEGAEGLRQALKDMLLYYDMETQALWPQKNMVEILGKDFFRYHNKERIKNRLYTRAIWPQTQMVEIKNHPYFGVGEKFKREIRIAPKGINLSMGYWIYGNKTVFISSQKESFGFIIESAEFVEVQKNQFEILWNLSRSLSVPEKYTAKFLREANLPE